MISRRQVATLLVHALTGDSWGIQEVLIEADLPLTAGWPPLWELGKLLRDHLPDDARSDLAVRLRREIASSWGDGCASS